MRSSIKSGIKKIIYGIIGMLLFCSNSCEDSIFDTSDDRLKFKNLSVDDIYFYHQSNYPDTTIAEYNPLLAPQYYKVKSQTTETIKRLGSTWEQYFENHNPSDTLQIFVYDADILETTSWEEIKSNNLYLDRIELSYQDILDRNWIIEYTN